MKANRVVESPHRLPETEEIPKFPVMVQGGGVPNDVIVGMGLVHMGTDDNSVFPLGEVAGHLIA